MANIQKNTKAYDRLKTDLEAIVFRSRSQLEKAAKEIAVRAHWEVGQRLSQSLDETESASANTIITALAQDLNLHKSVLYRAFQFFRAYPDGLPATPAFEKLSWGAHTELLPVSDQAERLFYITSAAEKNWTRQELRQAIQADEYRGGGPEKNVKNKTGTTGADMLARPVPGLYTYAAELERVVDGDTLVVRLDLGFDVLKRERIRLRGVDAPELATPEGEKAKAFVEKTLKGIDQVVLRTHWHDMYGRYVADVCYTKKDADMDDVLLNGRFLNQELLDQGLAVFAG